jgi:hypothetical protein
MLWAWFDEHPAFDYSSLFLLWNEGCQIRSMWVDRLVAQRHSRCVHQSWLSLTFFRVRRLFAVFGVFAHAVSLGD